VGTFGGIVGFAEGPAVDSADGIEVVGNRVGIDDGDNVVGMFVGEKEGNAVGATVGSETGLAEGAGVGMRVGCCVGGKAIAVTPVEPIPATAKRPVQDVAPMHPCSTINVCLGVPAGTVNCTCAHESAPLIHCGGGGLFGPMSS